MRPSTYLLLLYDHLPPDRRTTFLPPSHRPIVILRVVPRLKSKKSPPPRKQPPTNPPPKPRPTNTNQHSNHSPPPTPPKTPHPTWQRCRQLRGQQHDRGCCGLGGPRRRARVIFKGVLADRERRGIEGWIGKTRRGRPGRAGPTPPPRALPDVASAVGGGARVWPRRGRFPGSLGRGAEAAFCLGRYVRRGTSRRQRVQVGARTGTRFYLRETPHGRLRAPHVLGRKIGC